MSKNVTARILLKADSTEAWNLASDKDFKVKDRESIFYRDADRSVHPVPMKVNLTGKEVAPNELDFICECATDEEIDAFKNDNRLSLKLWCEDHTSTDDEGNYPPMNWLSVRYSIDKPITKENFSQIKKVLYAQDVAPYYCLLNNLISFNTVYFISFHESAGGSWITLEEFENCKVEYIDSVRDDENYGDIYIYKVTNLQPNAIIKFAYSE